MNGKINLFIQERKGVLNKKYRAVKIYRLSEGGEVISTPLCDNGESFCAVGETANLFVKWE